MRRRWKPAGARRVRRIGWFASCAVTWPALLFASLANAQELPRRARSGLVIGTSMYTTTNTNSEAFSVGGAYNKKKVLNVNAGGTLTIPLTNALSFQPEVHYGVYGVLLEATSTTAPQKLQVKLDVVEIPLLLRYDFGNRFGHFQAFVVGGASAALRFGCKRVSTTPGRPGFAQECNVFEKDNNPATSDPFKKYDAMGVGGAGVIRNIDDRAFSLQLRYVHGFVSTITQKSYASAKPKNRALMLLLGVSM